MKLDRFTAEKLKGSMSQRPCIKLKANNKIRKILDCLYFHIIFIKL